MSYSFFWSIPAPPFQSYHSHFSLSTDDGLFLYSYLVMLIKPCVDRREDDLRTVIVPKLHLAGGIPMPGMTASANSPKRSTTVVVNTHHQHQSSPVDANGRGNKQFLHQEEQVQQLASTIGGLQLSPRHIVGAPIPLNGGVNESVVTKKPVNVCYLLLRSSNLLILFSLC